MKKYKPSLETNRADIVASVAKGIAGACPIVGGLIAVAINQIIPNQKLDRIIDFLKILDNKISKLDSQMSNLKKKSFERNRS